MVLLCLPFLEPLLALLGAKPQIMVHAKAYALPFLLGIPFSMAGYSSYTFFRATGQTIWAMWFMLLQTALNIALDFFLILGFWIFPKLGLAGAGWAYLISWVISDIAAFMFITTPKYELPTNVFKDIKFTEVGERYSALGSMLGLAIFPRLV